MARITTNTSDNKGFHMSKLVIGVAHYYYYVLKLTSCTMSQGKYNRSINNSYNTCILSDLWKKGNSYKKNNILTKYNFNWNTVSFRTKYPKLFFVLIEETRWSVVVMCLSDGNETVIIGFIVGIFLSVSTMIRFSKVLQVLILTYARTRHLQQACMHALQLYTYIWLSCMQRDRRSGAANQDSDLEMQYV